jgi:hypothetical protein
MSETQDAEEVRRATKLLEALTKSMGLRKRDLDAKLGKGTGYHSQVFSGRMELKYGHVISVLRVLAIEPKLFFQALYPEPNRPTLPETMMERFLDSLQRLGYGAPLPSPPPAPTVSPEELDRKIREAVAAAVGERLGKRP